MAGCGEPCPELRCPVTRESIVHMQITYVRIEELSPSERQYGEHRAANQRMVPLTTSAPVCSKFDLPRLQCQVDKHDIDIA